MGWGEEPQNEMLNSQIGHQQQTNTTPAPYAAEMNIPSQGNANLEPGGEETALCSMPANSKL